MKSQKLSRDIQDFYQWRSQLYNALGSRRSEVMELLDSLSSNFQASSVVELSLNPLFRRDYNSLYKGIQDFLPTPNHPDYQKAVDGLFSVVSTTVPEPVNRQFYLFGVDVTPYPRPYSATIPDKTYIYQPNAIKGNKPINIGHAPIRSCCFARTRRNRKCTLVDSLVRTTSAFWGKRYFCRPEATKNNSQSFISPLER